MTNGDVDAAIAQLSAVVGERPDPYAHDGRERGPYSQSSADFDEDEDGARFLGVDSYAKILAQVSPQTVTDLTCVLINTLRESGQSPGDDKLAAIRDGITRALSKEGDQL